MVKEARRRKDGTVAVPVLSKFAQSVATADQLRYGAELQAREDRRAKRERRKPKKVAIRVRLEKTRNPHVKKARELQLAALRAIAEGGGGLKKLLREQSRQYDKARVWAEAHA